MTQPATDLHVITMRDAIASVVPSGARVRWDRAHGERHLCPSCGADMMRVGLTSIAYTYEVCGCRHDITYDHLVEQLWHRTCLEAYTPANRLKRYATASIPGAVALLHARPELAQTVGLAGALDQLARWCA